MELISFIFILLIFFQVKHFIADYILQGKYMLGKFSPDWGFFFPLLAHSSVHALFTLGVCLLIAPSLWWLSVIDLVIHFIMDRIKAGPKYLGRFKALTGKEYMDNMRTTLNTVKGSEPYVKANRKLLDNTLFWVALGADQMVHHTTDLLIAFVLTASRFGI